MKDKYALIRNLGKQHSVRLLCSALGVARSAYYDWLKRKPSKRDIEDQAIRREILVSHAAAPCYGVDNIHADVRAQMICGRNRVRRLMRELGVSSIRRHKYKATTNARHTCAVAPNLLRDFTPTEPDRVWVCDITYIATDEGWLYLATVKDRFTREVVGYSMGSRITSELTRLALLNAISRRKPSKGLIHHSDRGIQYCCNTYRELLNTHGMRCSMSRKGNPYDNAVAENFFSCLKCEMVYLEHFATRRDAELSIFRYIEGFYNRVRRHSALGRISPEQFRKNWEAKLALSFCAL